MTDSPMPDSPMPDVMPDSPKTSGSGKTPYYNVGDLSVMTEAELQALWDEIPPDRQKFYESAYETALSSLGEGDVTDDAAMGIIEQILAHYDSGQVPIMTGNRWVQVPTWVREKIEKGEDLTQPVAAGAADTSAKPRAAGSRRPSTQLIVAAVGFSLIIVCLIFTLVRRLTGGPSLTEEEMTGTAVAEAELAASTEPSPTPFSLGAADSIIRDGEDFKDYYPVLLEIDPAGGAAPRVFVVQQKPIEIADWQYDDRSEDVASWISGLLVRPVLGIPYSSEGAALMENLNPEDQILLHMSTGTVLQFDVDSSRRVSQQDVTIFQQASPGIVLVLLGDLDRSDRLVVFGNYPPEQELLRDGQGLNVGNQTTVLRPGEPASLDKSGATVTVENAYSSLGSDPNELPASLAYLFVDIAITAGSESIDTNTLQFDLADAAGARYVPININPLLTTYPALLGQVIAPETTVQGTVAFYIPRSASSTAALTVHGIKDTLSTFQLDFEAPLDPNAAPPEVALISVETTQGANGPESVSVVASVFNPNDRAIAITQQDVFAIFSPVEPARGEFPVGQQVFVTSVNGGPLVNIRVEPGESIDLTAVLPWDGTAFVGISILEYQYVAQLQ